MLGIIMPIPSMANKTLSTPLPSALKQGKHAPVIATRFRSIAAACLIAATFLGASAQAEPQTTPAAPAPSANSAPKTPEAEPEALPPVQAELWIIAPHPREAWILRIDNTGPKAIRIPADARMLELSVELPEFGPAPIEPEDDGKPKNKKFAPKKPKAKAKKPIRCEAPAGLKPSGFPEERALLLAPGESYIDTFDPYLLCFGKNAAALTGAATVKPRLGFKVPKAKPSYGKKKAKPEPPKGPFAVEGTDFPAVFAPQYELFAPTMVLSYGLTPKAAEVEAKAPEAKDGPKENTSEQGESAEKERAPIVDANAPRLEIEGSDFVDAGAERSASITVKAKNAGRRSMLAVLRPRMLSFRIDKPDGTGAVCGPDASPRGMPRDSYKNYKAGESTSFSVLLGEVCPRGTFSRPGIYKILPTLHAEQSGAEHGITAFTAVVDAPKPTILRIKEGTEPFHLRPPKAVPTPKQGVSAEEAPNKSESKSN